jgi:O-antigen/teichoic acid export membrane protein
MADETARRQIRGSGLLLAGRLLSLALNLLTQLLIIRHLSKVDYGIFAYALALISTFSSLNRLGMEQTVSRFVPIYEEQANPASAAGAVLLALATMAAIGIAIVALVTGFSGLLTGRIVENPAVTNILVVMIALAPIDAFDALLQELFAALGKPRIIFLRKYVIGPCLKLAVISFTIATSGDVNTLAIAYLVGGFVSFAIYGVFLPKVLREHNLSPYFRPGRFNIEYRRLFRYSIPVFTADIANVLRMFLVVAILEYFQNLSEVADYRAVVPIARLNSVALEVFSMLFLPMAARLFAQKNVALLGEIQSHVGLWVTVLSFPFFAACISLAEPLITLLIGERYASSAPILAILAVGHFFKSALGLNRQSLRAIGQVRVLLYIEIITTVSVLLAALMLVPRFGATGAAFAAAATMIFYSSMNTFMLWRITGTNPVPWECARVYLIAAVCALCLWVVKPLLGVNSSLVSFLLAGISSIVVLLSCWKLLHVAEIFPEVIRFFQARKR